MKPLIFSILVLLLLAQVSVADTVERSLNREYLNASNLSDRIIVNLTPTNNVLTLVDISENFSGISDVSNVTNITGIPLLYPPLVSNFTKVGNNNYTFTYGTLPDGSFLNTSYYAIYPTVSIQEGKYIINGTWITRNDSNGSWGGIITGTNSFIVTRSKLVAYDTNHDNLFQEQELVSSLWGYFYGNINMNDIVNGIKKYIFGQRIV